MRRTFLMINALMLVGIILERSSSLKTQDPIGTPLQFAELQLQVPPKPQHLAEESTLKKSEKASSEQKAHSWFNHTKP